MDGVAQRHEKVAMKLGLAELILRDGYAPDLIGTDACKGAPKDIAQVRNSSAVCVGRLGLHGRLGL